MKKFKSFLLEYLTDEQRSRFASTSMTKKARSDTDHFFGKGNDEVREELKGFDGDKSEVHRKVEHHLGKEIPKSDYEAGKTQDKHGRIVNIGRQIKDEKLRNEFASDNSRAGAKKNNGHYVTVVRGTEVAGQTNSKPNKEHPKGHSWGDQSCKNVDTGSNRHYLKPEIKHGTIAVRVHDHTGQEIYRATLQPHHNDKKHVAYAVDSEYGVKHPSFTAHAHDVASRLSGEHKGGSWIYKKNKSVYDNNGIINIMHPNATAEHISTALKDVNPDVREAAIRHPNATAEHISTALKDKDFYVRSAAIGHPNATPEHISAALTDVDSEVREAAISHPNATAEHISTALKDKDSYVRSSAIHNPKATPEHINIALKDVNPVVREAAISHSNATTEHISTALKDRDWDVRKAAIQHPNATSEHISTALKDKDSDVRMAAISHPNVTPEHISTALKDANPDVREAAISHPNATPKHINIALKDENPYVRAVAKLKNEP